MKKANQIIILLLFVAFALSCSKKSSDSISPEIVGKWKEAGIKGSVTGTIQGMITTVPIDEVGSGDITELKADGTAITDGDPDTIKFKTSGTKLTFITTDATSKKTYNTVFNYSISGSKLLLTMDKSLFISNFTASAAAGVDTGIDIASIKDIISSVDYTQTFEKQ